MLKNNHPTIAWLLDYWASVVLMPALLLVIAALALVTLWWDRRDDSARQRNGVGLADAPLGRRHLGRAGRF